MAARCSLARWLHAAGFGSPLLLWLVSAATEPLAHWLHVAPVRSWLWQSVLCGWLSAATEPPARWLHVAHLLTARTGSHRAPTCGSHVTSHPGTALQVPSVSSTNWRMSANIVPSETAEGRGGRPEINRIDNKKNPLAQKQNSAHLTKHHKTHLSPSVLSRTNCRIVSSVSSVPQRRYPLHFKPGLK